MNKSIEQIRDEAADKAIGDGSSFFQVSDDGVDINMTEVFNRGFDAGARAGYLKAVEVLREIDKSQDNGTYMFISNILESKIDEVLK